MNNFSALARPSPIRGFLPWIAVWTLIALFQQQPPSNLALLLILASALSAFWWRLWQVLAASAASVLAFNYLLISPRGRLAVELREDAMLLFTMLGVSITIALLMSRMRQLATQASENAARAEQLREISERYRTAASPTNLASTLQTALVELFNCPCVVLLNGEVAAASSKPSRNDRDALTLVQKHGQELGPATGRYESFPGWVVPIRGTTTVLGAALVGAEGNPSKREHARALCSLTGSTLERHIAQQAAEQARGEEKSQSLRNALLASIAHDHRTPLATILGAASSITEQHDRLTADQRQALAQTIVDECEQLIDITENTLQLARFDTGKIELREDWQSAEELIGSAVQRSRRRYPAAEIRLSSSRQLPLFRGDGTLLVQLLDNLVNNAVQHAGRFGPIEVGAHLADRHLHLTVADQGPPISAELQKRMFQSFYRGGKLSPGQRGAGLGLAVCSAIATVHRGSLVYTAAQPNGKRFTLRLPINDEPLSLPME